MSEPSRRLPVGAEVQPSGGVHVRVWAPDRRRVAVLLDDGRTVELAREDGGYFAGHVADAGPGTRYRFRLDDDPTPYPDPASRFQPDGPHNPSEVIDPAAFRWTDADWRGVALEDAVLYEMHVGTFAPAGTFASAAEKLPHLKDLGVTLVEVMPVAEFPGRFGWGYDGVHWFAPTRLYGRPNDFRAFVDRAHALGIGVILDVVYNHFGPDGNYHGCFAKGYFTDRYHTDWGSAIHYDGEGSGPVRELVCANVAYWIDEYHLDGLRLDATQNVYDSSPSHILADLGAVARKAAGGRTIVLVAENEPQEVKIVRPRDRGGYGLDALWNDDYHHTALVVLNGRHEAYYTDYRGTPQEFVSAAKYGYLYQGQYYAWQKQRRGTSSRGVPCAAFVNFLENHDQVANFGLGWRVNQLASPGRLRTLTALTLLMPGTPMLFQGQEWATSKPFLYFADHKPELAKLVWAGRNRFMAQFESVATADMQAALPDPADADTFARCRLDWSEAATNAHWLALHRDLLRLRREVPALRPACQADVDGAVLGSAAFVLRYFAADGDDRLLIVNLGSDLKLSPAPEPLLAPPEGMAWVVQWSSERPTYGGCGTPPVERPEGWSILGESAVLLKPGPDPAGDVVI